MSVKITVDCSFISLGATIKCQRIQFKVVSMKVEIFAVLREQSMYKRDCLKGQGQVKVGNSAWAHQVRKASPGSMHSSYIVLPHKEFQFVFFFSNIALCLSEKS